MNVVYFKPISESINQKKVLDYGRRTADADADGGRWTRTRTPDGGRGRTVRQYPPIPSVNLSFHKSVRSITSVNIRLFHP